MTLPRGVLVAYALRTGRRIRIRNMYDVLALATLDQEAPIRMVRQVRKLKWGS